MSETGEAGWPVLSPNLASFQCFIVISGCSWHFTIPVASHRKSILLDVCLGIAGVQIKCEELFVTSHASLAVRKNA